jgi:glycosyltransferase domain-containing protein
MAPLITIVILSYRRQPYLRRQLLYFAGKPVHLVIADASDEAWPLGTIGGSGAMSWEYFHVPGYDTYLRRLRIALERVNTEFMCFLDDEECLLWTGITEAVKHLATHPDQSCAGGMVAQTVNDTGGLSLMPWERWSAQWSLMDDSPLERFREMVNKERTANLYYQILRTAEIRRYAANLDDFTFSYRGATEIAMTGFLALSGKWEMGSYPFWIRHGGSVSAPASTTGYMTHNDTLKVVRILMATSTDGETLLQDSESLDYDAAGLEALIEMLWGARGSSDNRNCNRSPSSRVLAAVRARIGGIMRSYAPDLYSRLKMRHRRSQPEKGTFDRSAIMTFSDYANASVKAQSEVRADLENIEAIWNAYPDGVPAEA